MVFQKLVVVDTRGHLLGRLASLIAKELLMGQHVVCVRCEEINISGTFIRNKRKDTHTPPQELLGQQLFHADGLGHDGHDVPWSRDGDRSGGPQQAVERCHDFSRRCNSNGPVSLGWHASEHQQAHLPSCGCSGLCTRPRSSPFFTVAIGSTVASQKPRQGAIR